MQSRIRPHLTIGVAAVLLLILVSTLDGLTRPGYSLTRHWVSHLALGDRGWLGTTMLLATGVLYAAFGLGLRRTSPWGARLVTLAGVALIVAGAFRIDPGLDYPPGAAATHTTSGSVHDAAAGVLFLSLTIAAVILGRATGRTGTGVVVAVAIIGTFMACSVLVALDYSGAWPSAPSGLLEKFAIGIAMAWPIAVATQASRASRTDAPLVVSTSG
jgi:hypothetical membrane protein